jgi:hypothetical protein
MTESDRKAKAMAWLFEADRWFNEAMAWLLRRDHESDVTELTEEQAWLLRRKREREETR